MTIRSVLAKSRAKYTQYAKHVWSAEHAKFLRLALSGPAENSAAYGTRFVILSSPRSGSNLLTDLISQHPDIQIAGELFNPHGAGSESVMEDMCPAPTRNIITRNMFPRTFLREFWKQTREAHPHAAIGYKHLYLQDRAIARDLCADPSIRKIFLVRPNYLKQYLSLLSAVDNKLWLSPDTINEQKKYFIRIKELRKREEAGRREVQESIDHLKAAGQNYLLFTYDEIVDPVSRNDALKKIAEHLDIAPFGDVRARLVQQNPYTPRDMVRNVEEVQAFLSSRGDEWMLDRSSIA